MNQSYELFVQLLYSTVTECQLYIHCIFTVQCIHIIKIELQIVFRAKHRAKIIVQSKHFYL